jgi:hypothetical protein
VIDALYNLNEDPYEMNNLLGNNPDKETYGEKVEELRTELIAWLTRTGSSHIEGVKSREIY